ncbi:hypothetical protein [Rhodococcus sp. (in: high G+C Gram-positive bacteria)]|uniref:hypothetical protein n=1 Tax=Rhodococcus sp. TaxID=1831 RepID=UPI003B8A60E7
MSAADGDSAALITAASAARTASLPVMPNSAAYRVSGETESSCALGPSIGPGRPAARLATTSWERAWVNAAGVFATPVS